MKHLAVHKSRPTLSAQKASVPGWEAVLSQGKIKVSCLGLNPRLSSRLWERSIEFQGKAIQSRGERTRGKDEGRLGWKKWKEKANEGERGKTWSGDVWRFPRVAESIRPRLSALLLLFLPLAPGVDKTPQTPDAYAGKVPTPTTQYASDSPYSTPHLSPSAPPPSVSALRSLLSHFPLQQPSFQSYSRWIHLSPSSLILPSYPSLLRHLSRSGV